MPAVRPAGMGSTARDAARMKPENGTGTGSCPWRSAPAMMAPADRGRDHGRRFTQKTKDGGFDAATK